MIIIIDSSHYLLLYIIFICALLLCTSIIIIMIITIIFITTIIGRIYIYIYIVTLGRKLSKAMQSLRKIVYYTHTYQKHIFVTMYCYNYYCA